MSVESTIFGMAGTGDWSHPDHRPKNYRQSAFELFEDSPTPFTNILSKLPSASTNDPEYKFFEWRLPKMSCFNKNTLTAATALKESDVITLYATADGGAYLNEGAEPGLAFKEGDILRVEDPADCSQSAAGGTEHVVVTASTATTLTVLRYWGDTNYASTPTYGTIADTAELRWAGSVYAEGSQTPSALAKRATVVTNFTGIMKDVAKLTGTAEQMETRPYKPWAQHKGEALERHMIKLEWAMINSVKDEWLDPTSGEYMRTPGGFRYWIEQAQGAVDFSSGVDVDTIENEMETTFTYGAKKKAGFSGYRALNIINKMVRTNTGWNWNGESLPKKMTYGLTVFELRSPFGTLNLVPHQLMAESAQQTQDILIMDTQYVEYVKMKNRDTKFKDNVQLPDEDARKGYFMTECGLRLALPETHAVWTGLAALAA